MLLHAASRHEAGAGAALARAQARREALLEALELAQASSPGDPARARTMTELAQCARSSFHADEQELFACVRRSRVDLAALDHEMAVRQEALLSAGKNAAHVSSVPIVPTAKASGQTAG